ncbi:hypothetical protein C8J57DRAFT_1236230 [Mycena rebaudengoi]|nr:hypothetical protein C8J57DRAFT_1236230 [Mycena rebaudengoi]
MAHKPSPDNMDPLFSHGNAHLDSADPRGVELVCLAESSTVAAATSSYTDGADRLMLDVVPTDIQTPIAEPAPLQVFDLLSVPQDEMVMETVSYIAGDTGSVNYNKMKASALTWCKDPNRQ